MTNSVKLICSVGKCGEGEKMESTSMFIVVHKIDRSCDYAEKIEFNTRDVEGYVSELITEIINNVNYRHHKILSTTSEVFSIIKKYLTRLQPEEAILNNIANRYWRSENDAAEKVKGLKVQIKKGFLIEALLAVEENYYYFISKVEVDDFIDEEELTRKQGLPYKEKALKSCIFIFDSQKQLLEVLVSDKNKTKYWSEDFLDLEECTDNESSTKKIYDLIERKIRIGTSKSKKDYYLLRESLISYFRNPREFVLEEMYDLIFDTYEPLDREFVNVVEIKNKIADEIKKKKLDTEFSVVPKAVEKKTKTSIRINSFINIELEGEANNFGTMIIPVKEEGNHYLKVEADKEIYEFFNKIRSEAV